MSDKKTRYILTAAIGDALPGSSVELTEAQAEGPLYASRIALHNGGPEVDSSATEAELAEYLAEGKAKADQLLDDAKAQAKQIVEAAQAEAMKLATAPKK